jgi:hypothetical protein
VHGGGSISQVAELVRTPSELALAVFPPGFGEGELGFVPVFGPKPSNLMVPEGFGATRIEGVTFGEVGNWSHGHCCDVCGCVPTDWMTCCKDPQGEANYCDEQWCNSLEPSVYCRLKRETEVVNEAAEADKEGDHVSPPAHQITGDRVEIVSTVSLVEPAAVVGDSNVVQEKQVTENQVTNLVEPLAPSRVVDWEAVEKNGTIPERVKDSNYPAASLMWAVPRVVAGCAAILGVTYPVRVARAMEVLVGTRQGRKAMCLMLVCYLMWKLKSYVQRERGFQPIPDIEATIHKQCVDAGADPELVAHLMGGSMFSPRDARRATELGKKAWQWMLQNRKNWSNVVRVSHQVRGVAIALASTVGDESMLSHWSIKSVNDGIHAVDKFARTGVMPSGRALPGV